MATGLQRQVRRLILSRLKGDAALTAIVPADRIFSQDVPGAPAWPFIKLGPPLSLRLRMACVDGARVSLDVHAFAGPRIEAGAEVETGEDHASRIGENIERVLDDCWFDLPGDIRIKLERSDTQLLPDGEPQSYHYVTQVNAKVLAA